MGDTDWMFKFKLKKGLAHRIAEEELEVLLRLFKLRETNAKRIVEIDLQLLPEVCTYMGRIKARVSINLPNDLVAKARIHSLNISKVAEAALIHEINQLDNPDSENRTKGVQGAAGSWEEVVLRPGFEPGSPARKAGILNRSRRELTILPERH